MWRIFCTCEIFASRKLENPPPRAGIFTHTRTILLSYTEYCDSQKDHSGLRGGEGGRKVSSVKWTHDATFFSRYQGWVWQGIKVGIANDIKVKYVDDILVEFSGYVEVAFGEDFKVGFGEDFKVF